MVLFNERIFDSAKGYLYDSGHSQFTRPMVGLIGVSGGQSRREEGDFKVDGCATPSTISTVLVHDLNTCRNRTTQRCAYASASSEITKLSYRPIPN